LFGQSYESLSITSILGDLSIKVDLSWDIASKSVRTLRLHLTGDGRWMVPSSSEMDSATNSGESLLGAHFIQMHEVMQGEL